MESVYYYDMPLIRIGIMATDDAITRIFFDCDQYSAYGAKEQETPLIREAAQQLREYFSGIRKDFDLPLAPHGTPFQKKVWQALRLIPYGSTCSYKDIAVMIDHPLAARAVGQANNRNPIVIINPCHRVIGANGSLVGFAGRLDLKEKLLLLENPAAKFKR